MQKGAVFEVKTASFLSVTDFDVLRTANLHNKNPLTLDKTRGVWGAKAQVRGAYPRY